MSSSCSSWDSRMFRLMSVEGAPSFKSMVWSHGRSGGSLFDSSSLKTFMYHLYWGGIRWSIVSIFPLRILIGRSPAFLAANCALAALRALRTMGNCEWSIHPLAQSILGCAVANHGYPKITLWSPRSVRKYCRFVFFKPILVFRST